MTFQRSEVKNTDVQPHPTQGSLIPHQTSSGEQQARLGHCGNTQNTTLKTGHLKHLEESLTPMQPMRTPSADRLCPWNRKEGWATSTTPTRHTGSVTRANLLW